MPARENSLPVWGSMQQRFEESAVEMQQEHVISGERGQKGSRRVEDT